MGGSDDDIRDGTEFSGQPRKKSKHPPTVLPDWDPTGASYGDGGAKGADGSTEPAYNTLPDKGDDGGRAVLNRALNEKLQNYVKAIDEERGRQSPPVRG